MAGCLTLPRRLRLDGDRLVSELEPAVRSLVGEPAEVGPDGELPAAAYLRVSSPVTLTGSSTRIDVTAGAEVWVDDDVVEVYPATGAPQTYRDPGTASWRVGPSADVTVFEVGRHR